MMAREHERSGTRARGATAAVFGRRVFRFLSCAAAAAAMGLCCFNPFFPPTGTPDKVTPLRATPEGVIQQLINSYEQQRIDLFQDLLPADSNNFQFYVSPSFLSIYNTRLYANPPEPRDTQLIFIGNQSYYYYWTQENEVRSHKNLFSRAVSIIFSVKPDINPGSFHYIVNARGDTTNVEMEVTNGEIDITIMSGGLPLEYAVSIDRQVFFLKRDPQNLWVIRKWYDFGSQPS